MQPQPDALDRRFSLGLQDYDSTVGLRSLGVVLDHAALEKALGDLLDAPERCAAMGEAGRERIESVFAWHVVSEQYRELWSELGERRASASQNGMPTHGPWHIPHGCLPPTPGAPPSEGPWWLAEQGSDPNLLTDTMQTCFLQQLIPIRSLVSLADNLKSQTSRGRAMVETNDLEQALRSLRHPSPSVEPPHQPA